MPVRSRKYKRARSLLSGLNADSYQAENAATLRQAQHHRLHVIIQEEASRLTIK